MSKRNGVYQFRLSEREKKALERTAKRLDIKDISTLLKFSVMKLIIEYELQEINEFNKE